MWLIVFLSLSLFPSLREVTVDGRISSDKEWFDGEYIVGQSPVRLFAVKSTVSSIFIKIEFEKSAANYFNQGYSVMLSTNSTKVVFDFSESKKMVNSHLYYKATDTGDWQEQPVKLSVSARQIFEAEIPFSLLRAEGGQDFSSTISLNYKEESLFEKKTSSFIPDYKRGKLIAFFQNPQDVEISTEGVNILQIKNLAIYREKSGLFYFSFSIPDLSEDSLIDLYIDSRMGGKKELLTSQPVIPEGKFAKGFLWDYAVKISSSSGFLYKGSEKVPVSYEFNLTKGNVSTSIHSKLITGDLKDWKICVLLIRENRVMDFLLPDGRIKLEFNEIALPWIKLIP